MKIFIFIMYVLFTSTGLILFKLGSSSSMFGLNLFGLKLSLSVKMIFGIFFYCISFLLWLYIVSYSQLTFIYPLSIALVNVAVLIGSCIFLKESLNISQIIGIVVLILGVSLISVGKQV